MTEVQNKYGFNFYSSYEQVLEDKEIDIVILVIPNHLHAEYSIKALKAGKHVVCEKPMATSIEEARQMIEASKECDKKLFIKLNRRFDLDFVTVASAYKSGIIGKAIQIDTAINNYSCPNLQGFRSQKDLGGGYLLDWGQHLFDQLIALFDIKPKTIFASCDSYIWPVDVDTQSLVMIRCDDSLSILVDISNIARISKPRWLIRGELGSILYTNGKCTIRDKFGEHNYPNCCVPLNSFYKNIYDTLEGRATPIITIEQAFMSLKLVCLSYQSAQLGQSVNYD
jgi:predicted dehydrogenase